MRAVYQSSDITPTEIHVTAPRSTSHRQRGIRLHSQSVAADEITVCEGLRMMTVERAIADMATGGSAGEQIALAFREAMTRDLRTRRRRRARARRTVLFDRLLVRLLAVEAGT